MLTISRLHTEWKELFVALPTLPAAILQGIRRLAEAEWPGDFERQVYVIDSQSEAWIELEELAQRHGPDAALIDHLLEQVRERWPHNYELQLLHVHAQLSARHELEEIRTLYADMPADMLATICCHAARTAADDLELMRYSVANQVDAWRRLNTLPRLS